MLILSSKKRFFRAIRDNHSIAVRDLVFQDSKMLTVQILNFPEIASVFSLIAFIDFILIWAGSNVTCSSSHISCFKLDESISDGSHMKVAKFPLPFFG